ncbi:RNA polymerase sigma factor [Paenibacillus radicis (ex Gao et al. 2016)]|uniref:RNA polymerase sigma factor n=1 Tax=Paenibacillus radicis (ex Gao et al. 2016) TaxID=1737354 RepID=A0A917M224_9BACL|nr:RNA polymerase sigma factor [Paenibacillus radicis (ex Gao et al. 2016)]GGG70033.1 RNA polymerase sigma factor [Paenibacillus radicis (ex Gao et al. 2016)]
MESSLRYLANLDALSFEKLMRDYGQEVWSFAYSIVKNHSMADDITQDVFLQVFSHVTSFRNESSIKTWLLKITRNISYNYRKAAFIRKVFLVGKVVITENSISAEQSYFEKEATNDVWKQVFKLPVKLRETIILHAKYQLSISEIAQILDIPQGTVRSRLFEARKKMNIRLGEVL